MLIPGRIDGLGSVYIQDHECSQNSDYAMCVTPLGDGGQACLGLWPRNLCRSSASGTSHREQSAITHHHPQTANLCAAPQSVFTLCALGPGTRRHRRKSSHARYQIIPNFTSFYDMFYECRVWTRVRRTVKLSWSDVYSVHDGEGPREDGRSPAKPATPPYSPVL